jgi:hypothetical protein
LTVVSSGSNTVTLSATNAHSGGTFVNGNLLLTGSLPSGGSVNVNPGGMLSGTGTCAGSVLIASGATIAPGANGTGTITIGSLGLSQDSVLNFELGAVNSSDQILLNGSLTSTGNTTVNIGSLAGFGAGTYFLVKGGVATNATNFVLGTSPNGYGYALAATNGNLLLSVTAPQTITFPAINAATYGDGTVTLAASASSGLPVSYSSGATNISINSNTVTILGAGTASIVASQPGGSGYLAAATVTNTLVIAPAGNVIAPITPVGTQAYSLNPTFSVAPPAASSGLPVILSVKSGPATISSNTVTITGTGTVVLAANQAGNGNYLPATEVTTSFAVTSGSQSVSFPSLPSATYGGSPLILSATSSSGLPVSYSSASTNIVISGNTVTLLGAGTASIVAGQSGSANWSAATSVTNALVISKATNVISAFGPLGSRSYSNNATFTVTAPTASSGLSVTLGVKSGPASISGSTVTVTGTGTVVLSANQAGNGNYQVYFGDGIIGKKLTDGNIVKLSYIPPNL